MFLRQTISVILILNTLIGILWQPLVYVDFKLRQDYIAEVLCIEKDEPIAVCKGNCVLTSRLAKLDPPKQQNRRPLTENRLLEINFYLVKEDIKAPSDSYKTLKTFYSESQSLSLCNGFALDTFNPPKS